MFFHQFYFYIGYSLSQIFLSHIHQMSFKTIFFLSNACDFDFVHLSMCSVLISVMMSMCVSRIVCEMGRAEMSQYTGNVQVCVGVGPCRPEFMAKSSKYYYFVVSAYRSVHMFVIISFQTLRMRSLSSSFMFLWKKVSFSSVFLLQSALCFSTLGIGGLCSHLLC